MKAFIGGAVFSLLGQYAGASVTHLSAILFVAGLVLGAILFGAVEPIEAVFPPHWGWLVAGGLFVGYGTRLGSGCTSGHGVCGMSRLSPRSLVATGVFMASGIATVALVNALGYGW